MSKITATALVLAALYVGFIAGRQDPQPSPAVAPTKVSVTTPAAAPNPFDQFDEHPAAATYPNQSDMDAASAENARLNAIRQAQVDAYQQQQQTGATVRKAVDDALDDRGVKR